MIYNDYWYQKRLKASLYMVGGPGITFATSTAVGNADAVTRFLLANAARIGYAQSAPTEVPAQRAHLLRASEATRHACSSNDGRALRESLQPTPRLPRGYPEVALRLPCRMPCWTESPADEIPRRLNLRFPRN